MKVRMVRRPAKWLPPSARQHVDDQGRLRRDVWRPIHTSQKDGVWVSVLTLRGCGHVVTKRSDTRVKWTRVRCRMCESRFIELDEKRQRRAARDARRAARQKKMEEKLRQRNAGRKIKIRIKRKTTK